MAISAGIELDHPHRATTGPGEPPAGEPAPAAAMFRWLVRLRWLAIAGVALVLTGTGLGMGLLPEESVLPLWATLAALAAYNAVLGPLGHRGAVSWPTSLASQIVLDCLVLAVLVRFAGGVENPFLSLFVLHVVNANIVLRPRAASALLILALALVATIVVGEATGLLTHYCLRQNEACWARTVNPWVAGALSGLALTLGASSYFARHLTARLQESERRLAATVGDLSVEKERLAETRAAIEIEHARLGAIIDGMGDGVTFSDPEGHVLLSNARARRLRPASLDADDGAIGPSVLRARFQQISAGRVASDPAFERDGRTYEVTRSVVRARSGEPLGLVTLTHDITDRLALERHLMHEERMAVVGKVAAAVAHEINNPIGVVSLYAQHALAKLPADSPLGKHLETILRNAESCRKITGGLLELARPRTPERAQLDMRQLCKDVVVSVLPLAAKFDVSVTEGSQEGAAPLWATGDENQLRQAVLNLALNAVEASPRGGEVLVRAYETGQRSAAAHVIEVRDTGPGIPSELLPQIFQPFFTTKASGTGLGLAVADNIVKGHGGSITVESAEGHGATFRIVLPVAEDTQ